MDDDFEIEITDLRAEVGELGGWSASAYTLPRPVRLSDPDFEHAATVDPLDRPGAEPVDTAARAAANGAHDLNGAGPHSFPTIAAALSAARIPADESFAFEVTDLDGQPVASTSWLAGITGREGSLGSLADRVRRLLQPWRASAEASRPLATRQLRARRRLASGLAALGTVVAALLIVLGNSAAPRALVSQIFATPTPTAIGANTLLLTNMVPWGRLRIDGNVVSPRAYGGVELINLTGGEHAVRYDASPFPPLRCHLTVPAAKADTCPMADDTQELPPVTFGAARLLDMGASVSKLSPNQLAGLTQVVQGLLVSLTTTATVAPGDHYSTPDGTVVSATQQLRATFIPVLNTDPAAAPTPNGTPCVTFCDNSVGTGNGFSDTDWTVLVNVRSQWDISTIDGKLLDIAQPTIPGALANATLLSVPVALTWSTAGWQLASQAVPGLANPAGFDMSNITLCSTAQQLLPIYSASFNGGGGSSSCTVAANAADGCVVTWQAADASGNQTGPPMYLLYRFGALLAANQEALKGFPRLPVADASEQTLAQQIVASQGQPPNGVPTAPVTTPSASG